MIQNKIYTPSSNEDFVNIIWERQRQLGLSDYQLARESGLSRSTISRWKSGKREPMTNQLLSLFPVVGLEIKVIEKD